MKLSELIKHLEREMAGFGDMECYTNSEHGDSTPEILTTSQICIGSAEMVTEPDHLGISEFDVVCHIGGY